MLRPTLMELMRAREVELSSQINCLTAQLGELRMWLSKEQDREDARKHDAEKGEDAIARDVDLGQGKP